MATQLLNNEFADVTLVIENGQTDTLIDHHNQQHKHHHSKIQDDDDDLSHGPIQVHSLPVLIDWAIWVVVEQNLHTKNTIKIILSNVKPPAHSYSECGQAGPEKDMK